MGVGPPADRGLVLRRESRGVDNRLRAAANESGYDGGFVQHYLGPLVYPQGMPRRLELVAGVAIVVWNGALYACIYWWLSRGAPVA